MGLSVIIGTNLSGPELRRENAGIDLISTIVCVPATKAEMRETGDGDPRKDARP